MYTAKCLECVNKDYWIIELNISECDPTLPFLFQIEHFLSFPCFIDDEISINCEILQYGVVIYNFSKYDNIMTNILHGSENRFTVTFTK